MQRTKEQIRAALQGITDKKKLKIILQFIIGIKGG